MKLGLKQRNDSAGRYSFRHRATAAITGAILMVSTVTAGVISQQFTSGVEAAGTTPLSSGAVVVDWNKTLVQAISTPGVQPPTIHPTRSFAIMHAAIYDAVVSITHSSAPYLFTLNTLAGARPDAAAAEAGHDTLATLYPSLAIRRSFPIRIGHRSSRLPILPTPALTARLAERVRPC